MTKLQRLVEGQDQILLAELTALLHNIGKLDPNFLASKARNQADAQEEVEDKNQHIPDYRFDRFAAPDPALLDRARSMIAQQKHESRKELAQALESFFTDPDEKAAIQALADDWDKAKEAHPFLARIVESAWAFNSFLHSNGPLYRCLVSQREPLTQIENELDSIEQALQEVQQAFQTAAEEEKKPLGLRQQELKERRSELQKKKSRILSAVVQEEEQLQAQLEAEFRAFSLIVEKESWPLADLLTLFWDDFFYQPGDDDESAYKRQSSLAPWLVSAQGTTLPALLILSHGEVSGAEKAEAETAHPDWDSLRAATAFGYERDALKVWELLEARHTLLDVALDACKEPSQQRNDFVVQAPPILEMSLGDTRWPVNEINLWDYASTIAALFKSSVAKAILEGQLPTVGEMEWRLLHVSFDGLAFWSHAHHVTDMLGRRQALHDGLDVVQNILEVQYPLGNEVYRDEDGSVFVVPDVDDLLQLEDENDKSLKSLLEEAFHARGIRREIRLDVKVSGPYKGKDINLAQVLQVRHRSSTPKPDVAATWWAEDQRPENAEICTVCGLRPVGYVEPDLEKWATSEKAEGRKICAVCLDRRGRRAQDWATDEHRFVQGANTIWTDEVADENGRFALVVGRFPLTGWLNGKLIATMKKSASFARIRRCWETTHQFWREVRDEILPETVGATSVRWAIRPDNVAELREELGAYHTYDAKVGGLQLGLLWDPARGRLWTAANLRYMGALLPSKDQELPLDTLRRRLTGLSELPLLEPSGYGAQDQPAGVDAGQPQLMDEEKVDFIPVIPLMTEPSLFMALVPADKALKVAQAIKKKYDTEMARVRDRLSLHLGLVFAPRRTPLSAVLEAGRAMLNMPDEWEEWHIEAHGRQATFCHNGKTFTWKYPPKMGDDDTDDVWYPHLLTTNPTEKKELDVADFDLVDDLSGKVYVRPSRFDFEFLDTTARRFELHYNPDTGRRTSRPTRPYLLDDLQRLDHLWDRFGQLTRAQINQVIGAIEETRLAWDAGLIKRRDDDPVFWDFCADTLAGANWPKEDKKGCDLRWRKWTEDQRKELTAAAAAGELADLVELHLQILKEKREE